MFKNFTARFSLISMVILMSSTNNFATESTDTNTNMNINTNINTSINTKKEKIERKFIGTFYITKTFSNLHQHPSPYATSVHTLACGQSVKLYTTNGAQKESLPEEWVFAEGENTFGYLQKKMLSAEKPDCFQNKYPKFFDGLNLNITEIYYWGKLHDQYIAGKTKVK
ncbi:MAG: hypothetical protein HQK53_01500 [Oligoflexia bacterium]|nr:hypothetical protein [Oligoflexia bacterium]